MSEIICFERAFDLIDELGPLADRVKVQPAHWIRTWDGEYCGNNGSDFCRSCARAVCRNLRRHERDRRRRREYAVDGGWRTEHDHLLFCAGCGEHLDGSLTREGAVEEVYHFAACGVRPANPYEAHAISEALNALLYVRVEDLPLAEQLADIAEAFLWCAT